MNKNIIKHLAFILSLNTVLVLNTFAQTSHTEMRNITAMEIVAEMAPGVNLWNTLDAHCSWLGDDQGLVTETCWGNPYTTPEIIAGIAQRGFKSLRLPVTWYMHTGEEPEYTIDPLWLDRVEEVANYAFDNNMYVIINIHHDDKHDETTSQWLNPTFADSSQNIKQLEKMWTQIATRFKDYGDYLIFETMNEPREVGSTTEWSGGSAEHREVINKYNEVALNTIRATGGNNSQRFVSVPQVGANLYAAVNDMVIPNNDSKVIVAVHAYSPYNFALNESNMDSWGSASDVKAIQDEIGLLADEFTSKGQAVYMGEWGVVTNKPLEERVYYYDVYTKACKDAGIAPIPWMFNYNRNTQTWETPTLENAILKHYYNLIDEITFDLGVDTIFVGDSLQLSATSLPANIAVEYKKWGSSKYDVATVSTTGKLKTHTKGAVSISVGINGMIVKDDLIVLDTVKQLNYQIEAEDFDNQEGIVTESTSDVGGGDNIGHIAVGDWSSYTIIIDSAGIYDFSARAASASSGGSIQISVNGEYIKDLVVDGTQSTGWQDWFTTGSVELALEEGVNEIKLTYTTEDWGLYNINWYQLDFNRPGIITAAKEYNNEVLNVYPNPTSGVVYLSEETEFFVLDVFGLEQTSGIANSIDLSVFPSGVYVINTKNGAVKVIKK